MKLTLIITGVFLIFALLTSCEAATENKDMPIEKEVTDFIDNFEAPESGDFVNSAYDAFIKKYPAGHCDVWSNGMISFYYYNPDSSKEYGAIYLDSKGEKVKSGCGVGITNIKSYKGKYVSEENTPVDTTPVDTTPVDTTPVDITTPVDTTPVDTTPVETPADSTQEKSDTNQEQSDSIKELSDSVKELSDSIKQQSDPVQQQSDPVQQQSDSVQQKSDTNQKTTWGKISTIFVKAVVVLAVVFIVGIIMFMTGNPISIFAEICVGVVVAAIVYILGLN